MMRMFAIFDKKAQIFSDPICRLNSALAERDFQSIVGDTGTVYYKHPDDFALYEIGVWNAEKAEVQSIIPPVLVCDGSKFKAHLEVVN